MPLFSVIIPTYNRAGMVKAAIESVLCQTCNDYEVIVVDDGSTDETTVVLRQYDSRVRLVQQSNSGPGAARNRGIAEARGEYLAFLDSDDRWFPWTLEVYGELIRQYQRPAGLLGARCEFSSEAEVDRVRRQDTEVRSFADSLATWAADTWFATPVTVLRRDIVQSVSGFRTEIECFEDLDLWLRLGTIEGLVQVLRPHTLAYRRHAGAVTLRAGKVRQGAMALLEAEADGLYPGGALRRRERQEMVCRLARAASVGLARRGWLGHAVEVYRAGFRSQLMLRRWRYLLGFPVTAAAVWLRGGDRVGKE